VDPKPATHAFTIGAAREGGDIEGLKLARNAIVHNGEYHEVRGYDFLLVGFVCDSQSTSCHVFILITRVSGMEELGMGGGGGGEEVGEENTAGAWTLAVHRPLKPLDQGSGMLRGVWSVQVISNEKNI
jgi:hypothetical protein